MMKFFTAVVLLETAWRATKSMTLFSDNHNIIQVNEGLHMHLNDVDFHRIEFHFSLLSLLTAY